MEYTTLGSTGMEVSKIALGCMSFGSQDDWMLDAEEGRELVERAIDLGVNFFDTANTYSSGESEEILGDVLAEYDRDEQVVATKVRFSGAKEHRNAEGLSRKTIEQELDASLERLGMDTVDLYQIHRWDYDTLIETTLRALDDAVRRGKVRHIGASSMWAHQFQKALHVSDREGLARFETMQNLYHLAYREEEREMYPVCDTENIGVMPWSPLGAGYLTRPHDEFTSTARGEHELDYGTPYHEGPGSEEINDRVAELAADYGVTMAQIALAWHFQNEYVDAPIVGTSSIEHLEDAVEALEINLSASDVEYLEEPYEPVEVFGHE
ncbi:Putative oxidoreductase protein [Halorhabdus tiamatea SARL4B]|uniref:General stress protein, oxireductase n=1 Tax=Halorhabdus tiamatea SARL4B TaxID=1033806 RepID=F7PIB3_9EURY|nr:aldo/keto reductase [Halorhabdus tiamatea]ERJ05218.1 Putative oxidoreductase protein [Halorhabdus tiamatea SARL4B]CCQ34877.1 general stress protein, oxireductase [Halorhabdus tiamatea SARL4B]